MGANVSNRKRSAAALSAPLSNFLGWRLHVDCRSVDCARGREFEVGRLEKAFPGRLVSEAVRGMRCNGCQKPPAVASLRPGPQMRSKGGEIWLVGAGAV